MATVTRTKTITAVPDSYGQAWVIQWTGLDGDDDGDPIQMTGWHVRSVQISGTFDSATVVIQGSNDGTNYATLTDPQGNSLSKSSAAIEQIEELTTYTKPSVSGGGGSTNITVTMLISGGQPR